MVTRAEIKQKYNLNQDDLDWLVNILNPDQYEKIERETYKTDILYKKDNKIYMVHDTKRCSCYISLSLIWSDFKNKFGDNYILFIFLTRDILNSIYNFNIVITVGSIYCTSN